MNGRERHASFFERHVLYRRNSANRDRRRCELRSGNVLRLSRGRRCRAARERFETRMNLHGIDNGFAFLLGILILALRVLNLSGKRFVKPVRLADFHQFLNRTFHVRRRLRRKFESPRFFLFVRMSELRTFELNPYGISRLFDRV